MTSLFIWAFFSYLLYSIKNYMSTIEKDEKLQWIGISLLIGTFPAYILTSAMGLGQ
tara:strand:+ start:1751 stop:1918 length:168 start_codon:yes stop_codon:yes gene_type:complete